MAITLPLALIGVGVLIYLLFAAATYALPLIAGVSAAFASLHAGASGPTALLVGIAAFMTVIAMGRAAIELMPSRHARGALMLVFAIPAAIAGFQVASAMLGLAGVHGSTIVALAVGLVVAAVAARRAAIAQIA